MIRFLLGWTIELVVLPFGVVTLALIGAVEGAWRYLKDVGFIARNIGNRRQ